jgi:TPR repeat protein
MQLAEVQRAYRAGQYADALKLARPLADEGNAGAQLVLGEAYADGRGVVRDVREAEKWLELSSERGNIDATTRLGSLFAAMGNRNGAYMWYGCAAKLGSGSARAEQARLASSLQPSELTQAEQAIKSCVSKRTRS